MQPPITISVPHKLGKAEAKRRLAAGFADVGRNFAGAPVTNFTQTWNGDRLDFALHAMGQTASGHLRVEDAVINIEIQLPDFLMSLASAIKGRLQRQTQILLEDKSDQKRLGKL